MAESSEKRGLFYYLANAPLIWQAFVFGIFFVSVFPVLILSVMPVFSPTEAFASPAFSNIFINNLLLAGHIIAALPPLVIGPWMFHAQLRADKPKIHRIAGEVYIIGCLLSAGMSLPLALANHGGAIPRLGFSTLAVVWFITTWLGYIYARQKNFIAHRRWLMRSYACTFAFFNVKMYLVLGVATMDPYALKIMQSCVSWTLNMFVVEIYLAATTHTGKFVGWERFRAHLTGLSDLPRDIPALQRRRAV